MLPTIVYVLDFTVTCVLWILNTDLHALLGGRAQYVHPTLASAGYP